MRIVLAARAEVCGGLTVADRMPNADSPHAGTCPLAAHRLRIKAANPEDGLQ
ncbi:hypothetical protein ZHAS_00007981 [Anopheles sinensis]|uniref:Uncharacterized protein n=1 Tax=Anopheles sinensis TaxID=74873 RepID=A0A084VR75_ANOSI|nr:hypothetical protein ZHAS_00007981 [Anopheles sinensis]